MSRFYSYQLDELTKVPPFNTTPPSKPLIMTTPIVLPIRPRKAKIRQIENDFFADSTDDRDFSLKVAAPKSAAGVIRHD